MTKNLVFVFILIFSIIAKGQITSYTSATMQDFYALGGFSYTELDFPTAVTLLPNPYVRSGPSPNNDFTFVASSPLGLVGNFGRLTSNASGQSITLAFKGSNVRKMRAFVRPEDGNGIPQDGVSINIIAVSNLGNVSNVNLTYSAINASVGFKVNNPNEYLTAVIFAAPSNIGRFTTLDNIMIGDDTPQNVALDFDGINDHVEIPSTVGNFTSGQDFTVTCWVRVSSTENQANLTNTDNDILEKWDGTSNSYPFVIRYLNEHIDNQNAGNVGKIKVARYDGTNNPSITSGISIKDGKWHHIAFIRRAGVLQLRVDGVSDGSISDNTNQTQNNSLLYIGSRGNINHFKGEIDEVRIWSVGKTNTESNEERFCKTPNTANLQAAYNFSEGVPHGNNSILITKVNSLVNNNTNSGTLSNFANVGDVSNFVNGQIIYVDAFGLSPGPIGYTWPSAFKNIADGLALLPTAYTCDDLLFEMHVARGTYKPHQTSTTLSHNFPKGLKVYGGFSSTEKSINYRNMALIHTTNSSVLSGDLTDNDTPFNFDATRNTNSQIVVKIDANNVVLDGFTIKGGSDHGLRIQNSNAILKNLRIVDNGSPLSNNTFGAIAINNSTPFIRNTKISGNGTSGIQLVDSNAEITNSLISNNMFDGILQAQFTFNLSNQLRLVNCTIAANGNYGINSSTGFGGSITNNLSNTILFYNNNYILSNGAVTNLISNSLVQSVTGGLNNLNGTIVVPHFRNPVLFSVVTDGGDYRLKWCSLAINAGTNTGISPLDLDLKRRNFENIADIGAYEFLGNMPSQVNNSTITGTIDSPTYTGGAIQTITSDAKIQAPGGAIDFKAPNSITLNPGFEARGVGNYFQAQIGANETCVN